MPTKIGVDSQVGGDMTRQAKRNTKGIPTVQSVVSSIVAEHRRYATFYSPDPRDKIKIGYNIKKIEEVLQIRFAEKSEEKDFPECEKISRTIRDYRRTSQRGICLADLAVC